VAEHWAVSLRDLGAEAVRLALADARLEAPEALYVGNMLSGQLSRQENLGALIADWAGFRGIEALKVEAACASGGAALRMAYLAVASGLYDVVVACGVEKMTDGDSDQVTAALASAADMLYEGEHGLSFVSLNALLMQRYMHEYGYQRQDFSNFPIVAHANAANNDHAMYGRPITQAHYERARMIASPISLMDSSGVGDGAAAVVVAPTALACQHGLMPVRIAASSVATDSLAIHDRHDPLYMEAVALSTQRAYTEAGIGAGDLDFYELHDAFSIMAALSLEAAGLAERGRGVRLAIENDIALTGRIPVATMGGLKARGHPVGATGIYQAVEATQQLRGGAGQNQLQGCRLGMIQNIGGSGATVVTHILESVD
jgi:acetyl-CoA C-acetyltransferase